MRVARLMDEANWKSLLSIVENIFLPRVEFKYSPTNGPVIHSKRDGLTAISITRSKVSSLPARTMVS
jgi:hypothetical protein